MRVEPINTMKRSGFFLTGLLWLAGAAVCAAADVASERAGAGLAGVYDLSGVSRDASTYTGTVEVSELGKLLYWLEWRDSDGSYTGKGALVGDTLYAVWGSAEARCAAVFLSVGAGGRLEGFWFPAQNRAPERGRMTAEPEAGGEPGGPEGRYRMSAGALGGVTFPPTLEISALGDGYYRLRWDGDNAWEGVGLLDVDQLQAVVSPVAAEGQCGRSEMTLDADGNLQGSWMINDERFRTLGRETMIRR